MKLSDSTYIAQRRFKKQNDALIEECWTLFVKPKKKSKLIRIVIKSGKIISKREVFFNQLWGKESAYRASCNHSAKFRSLKYSHEEMTETEDTLAEQAIEMLECFIFQRDNTGYPFKSNCTLWEIDPKDKINSSTGEVLAPVDEKNILNQQ